MTTCGSAMMESQVLTCLQMATIEGIVKTPPVIVRRWKCKNHLNLVITVNMPVCLQESWQKIAKEVKTKQTKKTTVPAFSPLSF